MERRIRTWIEEQRKAAQEWLGRHDGVVAVAALVGCIAACVLVPTVIVPLFDQLTANPYINLGLVVAGFVAGFASDHYARKRRRAAAAKQAEQLKRDHPDLAAVIEILETYRSSADGDAAVLGLIQNLLFLAAGIAIPIILPTIIAKLQAP